jgi:hypothetical protein
MDGNSQSRGSSFGKALGITASFNACSLGVRCQTPRCWSSVHVLDVEEEPIFAKMISSSGGTKVLDVLEEYPGWDVCEVETCTNRKRTGVFQNWASAWYCRSLGRENPIQPVSNSMAE